MSCQFSLLFIYLQFYTFYHFVEIKTGNNSLLIAKNIKKCANISTIKSKFFKFIKSIQTYLCCIPRCFVEGRYQLTREKFLPDENIYNTIWLEIFNFQSLGKGYTKS